MPKLYEYLGILIYFYSNEHEPIHVHGKCDGRESRAEIILENGRVIRIVLSGNHHPENQMKTTTQYVEVTEAKYLSGYKLLLTFSDGAARVVDFGPFLEKARNPDTTDYRDLKKFKSFRIHYGDLVWGDYQMIFPIMDLYQGTILKSEKIPPAQFALRETATLRASSGRKAKTVSYKPSKRKKGFAE